MKKIWKPAGLLALLFLGLAFIVTGCDAKDEDSTPSEYSLNDFDGWWFRPEGYVSKGISIVDIFKVDAEAGNWTIYNKHGAALETFSCRADADGLTLNLDALGDATFGLKGQTLVDEEGRVNFVRGEPMELFDPAPFAGKWYKSGDTDSNYFLLDGNSYQKFVTYLPDEPSETGTWKIENTTRIFEDNSSAEETQLTFEVPGDMFGGDSYRLTEDNTVLFDGFHKEYYVKESILGTPAGDAAIAKFELICHNWRGPEFDSPFLTFSDYGTFEITTFNEQGEGVRESAGTWNLDGDKLVIDFNDGTGEIIPYAGESIAVERYGMTFTKND